MKTNNLICLIFSLFYIVCLFRFGEWTSVIGIVFLFLNAAAPISLVIYCFLSDEAYSIKNLIASIGFCLRAFTVFSLGFSSGALTANSGMDGALVYAVLAFQALGVLLMAAGTLYNFEYISLLKRGSAIFIGAAVISQAVGTALKLMHGYRLNLTSLISFISLLLFHIGVFIFADNKKVRSE